jgi:hypothetical protein
MVPVVVPLYENPFVWAIFPLPVPYPAGTVTPVEGTPFQANKTPVKEGEVVNPIISVEPPEHMVWADGVTIAFGTGFTTNVAWAVLTPQALVADAVM